MPREAPLTTSGVISTTDFEEEEAEALELSLVPLLMVLSIPLLGFLENHIVALKPKTKNFREEFNQIWKNEEVRIINSI